MGFFRLNKAGRERDVLVSKTYSVAFKQKMVARLLGKNAPSANQLAREVGIAQPVLSRWCREAHSLPVVGKDKQRKFTVEDKVTILASAANLSGEELTDYLKREEVTLGELEQWR